MHVQGEAHRWDPYWRVVHQLERLERERQQGVPETPATLVSAAQPDLHFTPREWANVEEDGIL